MALAIQTKHHGKIRFYREPQRNGGGIIAVFPKNPVGTPGMRECFVNDEGIYVEVDQAYLHTCRPLIVADEGVLAVAEFIARRADERTEYTRNLAATA